MPTFNAAAAMTANDAEANKLSDKFALAIQTAEEKMPHDEFVALLTRLTEVASAVAFNRPLPAGGNTILGALPAAQPQQSAPTSVPTVSNPSANSADAQYAKDLENVITGIAGGQKVSLVQKDGRIDTGAAEKLITDKIAANQKAAVDAAVKDEKDKAPKDIADYQAKTKAARDKLAKSYPNFDNATFGSKKTLPNDDYEAIGEVLNELTELTK